MALYEYDGKRPSVPGSSWVAPSAQVIGSVRVGEDCYIGHGAILRGDYGSIEIGDGSAIEEGVIVHARPDDLTRIGRRVTVGHGAMIHNATLEDGSVIGMRATVSDFAVVGEGAIIGEMTLVRQRQTIPPRAIAVGLPARVVGEVSEANRDMTVWAKELYVDLAHRYPRLLKRLPEPGDGDDEGLRVYPIGRIHTPFAEPEGCPIQGRFAAEAAGMIELNAGLEPALADLDGFSHIWLIYAFDRSKGWMPTVTPYLDEQARGLFATRAPRRPNPIGMSVVELIRVAGTTLHVRGVDMLDGTPLLDIKPYVPEFDQRDASRGGWLAPALARDGHRERADGRFNGEREPED